MQKGLIGVIIGLFILVSVGIGMLLGGGDTADQSQPQQPQQTSEQEAKKPAAPPKGDVLVDKASKNAARGYEIPVTAPADTAFGWSGRLIADVRLAMSEIEGSGHVGHGTIEGQKAVLGCWQYDLGDGIVELGYVVKQNIVYDGKWLKCDIRLAVMGDTTAGGVGRYYDLNGVRIRYQGDSMIIANNDGVTLKPGTDAYNMIRGAVLASLILADEQQRNAQRGESNFSGWNKIY